MQKAFSRKNIWDSLPAPLRSGLGAALAVVPLPLLLGSAFRRALAFVEASQGWDQSRVLEYQVERLRDLCRRARDGSSYYARVFKEVQFNPDDLAHPNDIAVLPRLTRDLVRQFGTQLCVVSPNDSGVDYVTTGGTSGAPLEFYIGSDRSSTEYAYLVSGWKRAGYSLGSTLAVLRGRVVADDGTGVRHEYDPLLRHHFYSNFHMSDADIARYLSHLRTIGPFFLHAYPSAANALARYVNRVGGPFPENIQGILTESEILYTEQREAIEATLGVRCFSSYGLTEKVALGAGCEQSSDYHMWSTYGYVELLDDAGNPVTTPGQRGEIVATGFINRVMPFLRYRTGDYATYVGPRCEACGRHQMVVRDIRGHRVQESLVATDGSLIAWTALNMHDDTFQLVRQFQFLQQQPGVATLRVVPAPGFGPEHEKRILDRLGRKLDGRVTFSVSIVDGIPTSRSGKAIYVDQQIPGH